MDRFDILKEKIDNRLDTPNIVSSGDNMSLYDLKKTVSRGFGKYNIVLVNEVNKMMKHMNSRIRKANLFKNDLPYIASINPKVENGYPAVTMIFADKEGRYRGVGSVCENDHIFVELFKNEFNIEKTEEFIRSNKLFWTHCLNALCAFIQEYPDTDYEWNDGLTDYNGKDQVIGDGFVNSHMNLEKIDEARCCFATLEDMETSRDKTRKYGELIDYIEFYNDAFMKKTQINVNDLNPLYRKVVDKTLENDRKLGKRVI